MNCKHDDTISNDRCNLHGKSIFQCCRCGTKKCFFPHGTQDMFLPRELWLVLGLMATLLTIGLMGCSNRYMVQDQYSYRIEKPMHDDVKLLAWQGYFSKR